MEARGTERARERMAGGKDRGMEVRGGLRILLMLTQLRVKWGSGRLSEGIWLLCGKQTVGSEDGAPRPERRLLRWSSEWRV